LNPFLQFQVLFGTVFDTGEEIFDQLNEDILIVSDDFGDIEVSKTLHQELLFRCLRVATFELTGLTEHGLNGTETPIVVLLFGKQVAGEHVEGDEFLGQGFTVLETLGHQHVFTNEFEVRHHHSARTELGLQVFRQFGTAGITRVHSNEEPDRILNI
jgi:hypothetical protein